MAREQASAVVETKPLLLRCKWRATGHVCHHIPQFCASLILGGKLHAIVRPNPIFTPLRGVKSGDAIALTETRKISFFQRSEVQHDWPVPHKRIVANEILGKDHIASVENDDVCSRKSDRGAGSGVRGRKIMRLRGAGRE